MKTTIETLHDLKNERFIRHIEFPLDLVGKYADIWFSEMSAHESLDDYCEQCGLDMKDPKVGEWVRAEILRQGRRAAA